MDRFPNFTNENIINLLFAILLIAIFPTKGHATIDKYKWRQKLTVEVRTPNGVVSGSSVTEVTASFYSGWHAMGSGANYDLRGEAVVVELAPKKYLLALLKGMPHSYSVFFPGGLPESDASKIRTLRSKKNLAVDQYPMLVTFLDVHDPVSIVLIDPADFTASFGQDYHLGEVSLELTDQPVTSGSVRAALPWLDAVGDGMIDGERSNFLGAKYPLANALTRSDFER